MLSRLLAFILSLVLLVLGFMFSLVALAVVATLVLVIGGRLWWKIRGLRRQMRNQGEIDPGDFRRERAGDFIDGEAVRTDDSAPTDANNAAQKDQRSLGFSEPRL